MERVRDRMACDLTLRGRAPHTRREYLRCAGVFAGFLGVPPGRAGRDDVRRYLDHLVRVRRVGPATLRMHVAALKFLYRVTLDRPCLVDWIPWPPCVAPLPRIPTRQEIAAVITAARRVPVRGAIMAGYGAGLRLSEAASLRLGDIDLGRGVLRVRAGKGCRARCVPLPSRLAALVREHHPDADPEAWLVPGRLPGSHITPGGLQVAVGRAVRTAGHRGRLTFHVLRHAYATHLLEDGVDVTMIQRLLGHVRLGTTLRYVHLTPARILQVHSPLDRIDIPGVP